MNLSMKKIQKGRQDREAKNVLFIAATVEHFALAQKPFLKVVWWFGVFLRCGVFCFFLLSQ